MTAASSPVKAAIVGLGRWGRNLATAAASDPSSQLRFTRAVTRTPAKAEAFCRELNLPVSSDFGAMLDDPDLDAVVLATPHSQHTEQIVAAADAGKHVFVEKPLALTLDQAARAAGACARNGVVLAVGFNRRFLPAYQQLCEKFRSGSLGTALHVEGNFSGPFGYDYSGEMWRGTAAENPAGGMTAMGVHILDAMIHLLGPVKQVTAKSARIAIKAPIDDTTTVLLEFASGATGSLTTLMATPANWRLQLFGSEGWAAMPNQHSLQISTLSAQLDAVCFDPVDTLQHELRAFAAAAQGQRAFPVGVQEANAGVAALQAIDLSARSNGTPVPVATCP